MISRFPSKRGLQPKPPAPAPSPDMLATTVTRLTVEDGPPQPEPVVMRGKAGKEVKITANYVRLELLAGRDHVTPPHNLAGDPWSHA